jgi:hypothetical protein
VSNWAYVAIAFTVVWGSLAVYALLLARRVTQAREVSRQLSEALAEDTRADGALEEQDSSVCDAPPAP